MTRPTDEILMAYADGHLDETSRLVIERHLLSDAMSHRFVHLMTLVTVISRQALAERDFSSGLERLVKRIEYGRTPGQCSVSADKFPTERLAGRHVGFGRGPSAIWLGAWIASVGVAVICSVVVPQLPTMQTAKLRELTVGEVQRGTALLAALDKVSDYRPTAVGRDFWRFHVVSEFADKFGNRCQELDAYDGPQDRLPTRVIVACQGRDMTWSVLAVIATWSNRSASYVTEASQARDVVTGVLEMLGAKRRTSSIKSESRMQ